MHFKLPLLYYCREGIVLLKERENVQMKTETMKCKTLYRKFIKIHSTKGILVRKSVYKVLMYIRQ